MTFPPLTPLPLDKAEQGRGTLVDDAVDSMVLAGNPLGDPSRRRLLVWLPPDYDDTGRRFPVIYVLPGYGVCVEQWCNRRLYAPTIFDRLDALYSGDDAPAPCIYAFVDGTTRYGGSQFVNSTATGRHQDYVSDDVVAHVDATYRSLAAARHRGVAGHSSGGIGALVLCMRRPDVFGACASHAGDTLFEHCYARELGDFARALAEHDGDVVALSDHLLGDEQYRAAHFGPLMVLGCAAAYSPDPDAPLGIGLPVDSLGRLQERHWERWLAEDPVRLAPSHADALRGLRGIYLDAGDSDEYYMDLGTAALAQVLTSMGVSHRYERFAGGHDGVAHRFPLAYAFLAQVLAAG
ncbi:MAG TPA: alpha/beta hydrolase-fold protein [Candidatus Dormibacteraeota bacterium]|nr:alpha/beta hydrolase-fold protein [Candidatus Dormibacteraeota bacterium]